ncbi:MAG: hypothetical protein J6C23_07835 [Clostridia bacterium]|nr:hypothetical protein [Clostridia bacterium]
MMNKIKRFFISILSLLVAGVPVLGCSSQQIQTNIKEPVATTSSETMVSQSDAVEVGLTPGFDLPHDDGLVGRDNNGFAFYEEDLYYLNDQKVNGRDPSVLYVSIEDITDTYNKNIARQAQFGQDAVDKWVEERGTLDDWIAKYGKQFYLTGSERTTVLTASTKQKYPEAAWAAYNLSKSADMNNWVNVGALDGYAYLGTNTTWQGNAAAQTWAPEYKRDPVSGMYLLAFSSASKDGNETTQYNPHSTGRSEYATNPKIQYSANQWDNMYLTLAIADNPEGPYRLLTAETYYQYLAKYNADGTVYTEQITEKNEYGNDVVKNVAIYRDDLFDGSTEKNSLKGKMLTYVNQKGEFLNLNGDAVTIYTPPVNNPYFHKEIIEAYPNCNIENRATWPTMDMHVFSNDRGEFYTYFTSHASTLHADQNVWMMRMKDWITPDWDSLTHVLAPSYSIVYYDPEVSEDLDWAKHSDPDGSSNYHFFDVSYPINGVRGFHLSDIDQNEGGVNEGAFMFQYKGWYYLTYSPFGYGSKHYAAHVSVSDNPYGPFIKIYDYSPASGIDKTEGGDMISACGHHCFVEVEGEMWCVYHCLHNPEYNYNASGGFMGRGIAMDRIAFYEYDQITFGSLIDKQIELDLDENLRGSMDDLPGLKEKGLTPKEWMEECFETGNHRYYDKDHKGTDGSNIDRDAIVPIMYGNGATYSLQPKTKVYTGYDNVAKTATVTILEGDTATAKYANDGMVTYQKWSSKYEVVGNPETRQLKLKLSWDTPQTIRNIMIYNSRDYVYAFNNVESIAFKLDSKPAWYPEDKEYNGYCHIKDLEPDSMGWDSRSMIMRKGGSAMATFNEITVSEIIITIDAEDKVGTLILSNSNRYVVKLSDIYIMGNPVDVE